MDHYRFFSSNWKQKSRKRLLACYSLPQGHYTTCGTRVHSHLSKYFKSFFSFFFKADHKHLLSFKTIFCFALTVKLGLQIEIIIFCKVFKITGWFVVEKWLMRLNQWGQKEISVVRFLMGVFNSNINLLEFKNCQIVCHITRMECQWKQEKYGPKPDLF